MAKIELRHADIYMRDGLTGTAAVNDAAGVLASATTLTYDGCVVNTATPAIIPVGARFTIAGETVQTVHTVTSIDTNEITFSPAIGAGTMPDDSVITILPRQIDIKIGDGNLTFTEAKNYNYELDRGELDTVKEGDDAPMAVNLAFVYEFVKTGTDLDITPVDALKGAGGAADWVSSSSDSCEPYAVDLVLEYVPVCSGASVESETLVFPDFRYDSLQYDLSAAQIAVTGRCNATEAVATRE